MASYETFRATSTFGSLDGLRAISILMVVWHHVASPFYAHIPLLRHGNFGVQFFFAISGFLITTLLLREREANGTISLKNFYLRRSLRIFPLYYAVILMYVVVVMLFERHSIAGQEFFVHLKYYLTYTSNWFVSLDRPRVIFYFAWSLATEEQFYLVWPSIEKFLGRRGPVAVAVALAIVSYTASVGLFASVVAPNSLLHRMLTGIAIPICLGVLLAHLLHARAGFDAARRVFGGRATSLVSSVLLVLLLGLPVTHVTPTHALLVYLAMTAVVASCVIREDHGLAPVLGLTPLRLVGVLSYGMYLLHMLCYNAVSRAGGRLGVIHPLVSFVATTLVTAGVAWVSYTYFEAYFLGLKKRFSRPGPAPDWTGVTRTA